MECEVVVVGGGTGGLTVAALLAQRGLDVCLLERASVVGGCAAHFEKFGYSFEHGNGIYASWEENEIHRRVFDELPVEPPDVSLLEPGYAVRLHDQTEIVFGADNELFEQNLRQAFPECASAAIDFYRALDVSAADLREALKRTPDLLDSASTRQAFQLLRAGRAGARIKGLKNDTIADHARHVSHRFRDFINAQLQTLTHASIEEASYLYAASALTAGRGRSFAITGGAGALSNRLAGSIRKSGGKIRLDTPVLRLAYDSTVQPIGVDLLSGEKVLASKAIISNLTIWDTYGKLIGLNRTPDNVRASLKSLRGLGAYLIYIGLDESVAASLGAHNYSLLNKSLPNGSSMNLRVAPAWDRRAPEGKRAATVQTVTDVEDWFTFHEDESDEEIKDQQMLEKCWEQLHAAMPEIGGGAEVIETANPRTFYESTRRKLGMVGGVPVTRGLFWPSQPRYRTPFANLFLIGDTVAPASIAELSRAALTLANHLTN